MLKKCKIVKNVYLKLAQKSCLFTHPLAVISSFANIDGPIWLFGFFTLNEVDIQLTLEFKHSIGKYHPVCPKNPSENS